MKKVYVLLAVLGFAANAFAQAQKQSSGTATKTVKQQNTVSSGTATTGTAISASNHAATQTATTRTTTTRSTGTSKRATAKGVR